jgi:RNA polymerase-binding transcription factor DksA
MVMVERFPRPASLVEALTAERARALDRIAALTRDRDGILESSALKGVEDQRDTVGATADFERSQIEALLDQARRDLSDVDRALRRLEDGGYGTCEGCGRPISPERLAARPAARTCITCAAAE